MFLLLYFIFRRLVVLQRTVLAMRCVIVSINHYLSIYLSTLCLKKGPTLKRYSSKL